MTSRSRSFIYGPVDGYIEQSDVYKTEFSEDHPAISVNEHLKPIIEKFGDLPQKENKCQGFSQVKENVYNRLYHLSDTEEGSPAEKRRPITRGSSARRRSRDNNSQEVLPSKSIENLYKNRFYDPGVMEFIRCTLMKMFTNPSLDKISQFWIKNIKRIGEPSADGEVSLGTIGGYSELVVFKISKKPQNIYSIMYEGLVGHQVNKLRRQGIVNFAYTYGVVKCGHKDFCKPEDTVLMQEFVKGVSYEEYVRKIDDPTDFMSAILQLVFGLREAYDRMRFQHLDLHNQNVMARQLDRKIFYIPYEHNGKTYFVKANRIMTIIDFGRSAIKVQDQLVYSAETFDSDPHGLSPVADIFKLLGFTLYRANKPTKKYPVTNSRIIEMAEELMKFFVDESDLYRGTQVNQQLSEDFRDTYYVLYAIKNNATYSQFLEYIRTNRKLSPYYKKLISTTAPSDQILECSGDCVLPTALLPNPINDTVTGALDYLIRANEGWPVKVDNWDQLVNDIEDYFATAPQITGLRELLRGAMPQIPKEYQADLEKLLRK